jgi:hypothetical protein
MIRKSHVALPLGSTLTKILGATLATAVLAAPAQAGVIGFETGYGTAVGSGETYSEAGFNLLFEAFDFTAVGSAVGAIIDGTDPFACVDMACPVGNEGYYYGAFNDSIVYVNSQTNGQRFNVKSFDASFIGANASLGSYPATAGLLRMQGWLADGRTTTIQFRLDGPGVTGFDFGKYLVPSAFSSLDFVQVAIFGLACNTTGTCTPFQTNQGQFGIDNLELTAVPEPASALLFGLGLAGLVAGARRRKA